MNSLSTGAIVRALRYTVDLEQLRVVNLASYRCIRGVVGGLVGTFVGRNVGWLVGGSVGAFVGWLLIRRRFRSLVRSFVSRQSYRWIRQHFR
jgi:hypothetical protein